MGKPSLPPIEILLIEDTLGGIEPIQYILKNSKLFNKINIVRDTYDAVSFLCRESNNIKEDEQLLIIFNLRLFIEEEIKAIKQIINNAYGKSGTVILTNNSMEEFLLKQQMISSLFIKKPFKFENFIKRLFSKYGYGIVINKRTN